MQNFPGALLEVVACSCGAKGNAPGPDRARVGEGGKRPSKDRPHPTPSSGPKSGGTHRTARPGWRCYPVAPAQATRRQASSSSRESLISKEAYRGRLQPAFSGLTNWLMRSLKLQSRHTGPPGTAPRARASYRTPKRRAPRYCQGLSVRLKE